MRRPILVLPVTLALVAACGARTPLGTGEVLVDAGRDATLDAPPDAPRDATRDSPPDVLPPPQLCPKSTPNLGVTTCSRKVVVKSITPSSPTCFLDLGFKVGEVGALNYACDGNADGAVILLGGREFRGRVKGDFVTVCIGSTFQYSDGCTWESAQTLAGFLSQPTLSFDYTETVLVGTSCAGACSATGVVAF